MADKEVIDSDINRRALRYLQTVKRFKEVPVLRSYDTAAPGRGPRVRQLFLDVNFGKRGKGLTEVAEQAGVPVNKMGPGDFVAFVNYERSKIALLTIQSGITIVVEASAPARTRIPFEFFHELPRIFGSGNELNFKLALVKLMKDFLVPKVPRKKVRTVRPIKEGSAGADQSNV